MQFCATEHVQTHWTKQKKSHGHKTIIVVISMQRWLIGSVDINAIVFECRNELHTSITCGWVSNSQDTYTVLSICCKNKTQVTTVVIFIRFF